MNAYLFKVVSMNVEEDHALCGHADSIFRNGIEAPPDTGR